MGNFKKRVDNLSTAQRLLCALLLCLLLWCCLPVSIVGLSPALLINVAVCLMFLSAVFYWDEIKSARGSFKLARNIAFALVGALVCGYIAMSVSMLSHAGRRTQEESPTVIVLGCKINGESPSLMLARRLNTARDFLAEHPQSKCIVSGGQGADEIMPESEAMKNYLVRAGIDPDRIFVENLSTNTQENLELSKKLMDELNLSGPAVIATDDFHQWRAQTEGERLGLDCTSAGSCATPWYLISFYWTREILALAAAFVL